ncbi:MAG: PAS domain S-box protein [Arcobacteraceae bacterium]|nr:PAS domain S-box protein [Arcobacteraceae bacterium]
MSNKIQSQNAVLKAMINSSWSGIGIINLDTKFLYINKAFSPLLGFSNEELLKLNFIDLITDENKQSFKDLIEKNAKDRYINNLQLSCKRKDGGLVFLDITISLMQDNKYIVLDASDITQTVSEHEIFDKYLIQTQIDLDGKIEKASEAYCRLCGYNEDELKGLYYTAFQDKSEEEKLWYEIKNSKEYSGTIVNKTKTGSYFWVESVIKPKYNKYGDIIGYTAVMFDVTNEMTLEEKKKDLLKQLVDKDEKLNIMTSTMRLVAHEWRQPLNTISLEVQNLMLKYQFEEDVTTEETVNNLHLITNHIEELSNVINNFQHTTEIKENKVETTSKEIIEKAMMHSNIQNSEVVFENNNQEPFLTYVGSLSQSIAHILDNAKEAINLSNDKTSKISIKSYTEDENNIFVIQNSAGHIPEDILGNIFTPYFSTKTQKNGVGLSLYNCKTIIELHLKGSIEVFNLNEDIVMFKIILPTNEIK